MQLVPVLRHVQGRLHGREVLTLTWQTAVGARETYDAILIDGTPKVDLLIRGGLHGDEAAAALILHAIPRALAAPHGLMTVLELPPLHYEPRPEPHLAWAR